MITLVDIKPDAIGAVDEVITSGDNFIPPGRTVRGLGTTG